MYCKYCGKQIADDCIFCPNCGEKVEAISLGKKDSKAQGTAFVSGIDSNIEENNSEVIYGTHPQKPTQVEVYRKSKVGSPIIADEIVGNLKMIGLAIVFFVVYMIGFILVHQKDITILDYKTHKSYLGESCYDGIMFGAGELNWEEHYYKMLYHIVNDSYPIPGLTCIHTQGQISEQRQKEIKLLEDWFTIIKASAIERLRKDNDYRKNHDWGDIMGYYVELYGVDAIKIEEKDKMLKNTTLQGLKEAAKEAADREIQNWNDMVNERRKSGYEEDLKEKSKYAALICLALMILGRYMVKFTKWVNTNKTKW